MAKDQYKVYKHVEGLFPSGDHTVSGGEWVSGPANILALATESEELLEAIGAVDEDCQVEYNGVEVEVSAAFAKDMLIKLLKAMDGRYVRLEMSQDGVLRVATVNWKFQPTFGLLAPIREEAREQKIENPVEESELFNKNSGEDAGN